MEDSKDKEEASVEAEGEALNQSSVIPMEYSSTTRGSVLMHSVHTMWPVSIMVKISLN